MRLMKHSTKATSIKNASKHFIRGGYCKACGVKSWRWVVGGLACQCCGHLIPLDDIRLKMVEAAG